ncbi:MAG: hypothetical protein M2R45_03160 [Verrucomicrobia subdivision 3 bacterium]|nr:hypothetical protein [Limisphaerales bacterium]MCS1413227.1 hypothetical protein [Limisphaerales bacterium]
MQIFWKLRELIGIVTELANGLKAFAPSFQKYICGSVAWTLDFPQL